MKASLARSAAQGLASTLVSTELFSLAYTVPGAGKLTLGPSNCSQGRMVSSFGRQVELRASGTDTVGDFWLHVWRVVKALEVLQPLLAMNGYSYTGRLSVSLVYAAWWPFHPEGKLSATLEKCFEGWRCCISLYVQMNEMLWNP